MCWSAVDRARHNYNNVKCHIYVHIINTNLVENSCWSAVDRALVLVSSRPSL